MTNKFKAGDKVRCIDAGLLLEKGATYTVTEHKGSCVRVEGKIQGFFPYRFELVVEAPKEPVSFKVGDTVRFVRCTPGIGTLRHGGTYTVEKVSFSGNVKIKDHPAYYGAERFEKVIVEEPKTVSFKVGGRVIGVGKQDGVNINGMEGTIHEEDRLPGKSRVKFGPEFKAWSAPLWFVDHKNLKYAPQPVVKPALMDDLGGTFTTPFRTGETKKTWIIAVLDSEGKPRPAERPAVYTSEKQAHTVAETMAEKHAGEVFMVFEGTAICATPKVVRPNLVRI